MTIEIIISYKECIRCKEYIKACSYGVLEWFDDIPIVVNTSNCAGCLECEKNYSVR